jgi:Flp pilus assembly protein TadB
MWISCERRRVNGSYQQLKKTINKGYFDIFNSFPQLWKTTNCGMRNHCGKLLEIHLLIGIFNYSLSTIYVNMGYILIFHILGALNSLKLVLFCLYCIIF